MRLGLRRSGYLLSFSYEEAATIRIYPIVKNNIKKTFLNAEIVTCVAHQAKLTTTAADAAEALDGPMACPLQTKETLHEHPDSCAKTQG